MESVKGRHRSAGEEGEGGFEQGDEAAVGVWMARLIREEGASLTGGSVAGEEKLNVAEAAGPPSRR